MNHYQHDFCLLIDKLIDTHPNVYHTLCETQFHDEKDKTLLLLEDVTDDFQAKILYQKFIKKINDGHTCLIDFYNMNENKFGIRIEKIAKDFYIKNIHTDYPEELIGQKIIQIADMPVKDTYEKISQLICSDNQFGDEKSFCNRFSNSPLIYKSLEIIQSDELTLLLENGKSIIVKAYQNPVFYKPRIEGLTKLSDNHFDYWITNNVCYFQFNAFFDQQTANFYRESGMFKDDLLAYFVQKAKDKGGDFRDFLNKMMSDIEKNQINHLIIDLRYNGGGNSTLGDQLLSCILEEKQSISCGRVDRKISNLLKECRPYHFLNYLKDKDETDLPFMIYDEKLITREDMFYNSDNPFYFKPPFKFKGQVYLLIGKSTFSSALMLAYTMSDNDIAITIGEPTSGKPTHYGDIISFTLPHTGAVVQVSHSKFYRPNESKNDEDALYPDYLVINDIKDFHFNGVDSVFEKALSLCKLPHS